MTEIVPTQETTETPPRRSLILAAITGFNLYLISGITALWHVLPQAVTQYFLGMTLLVWIIQASAGLVYERYYQKGTDRALWVAMLVFYGLIYVFATLGSNVQIPKPPEGFSTFYVVSELIIIGMGWIASELTRWTVWGDLRLRIIGL